MSKTFIAGTSSALIVSIVVLAFSSYGLGREEKDKSSPAYKIAEVFTGIAAVGTFIALFCFMIAILRSPALREAGAYQFDPKAL